VFDSDRLPGQRRGARSYPGMAPAALRKRPTNDFNNNQNPEISDAIGSRARPVGEFRAATLDWPDSGCRAVFRGLACPISEGAPDFGGNLQLSDTAGIRNRGADWLRTFDIAVLAAALGLSSWLVLKRRSRNGVLLLRHRRPSLLRFFRKGCVCPIGSIQNVTLSLVDSRFMISMGVILFFFLPLVAALPVWTRFLRKRLPARSDSGSGSPCAR